MALKYQQRRPNKEILFDNEGNAEIHRLILWDCRSELDRLLKSSKTRDLYLEARTQDVAKNTPLLLAASRGNIHMVAMLVDSGASLSAQNSSGRNVTAEAVFCAQDHIVRFLSVKCPDANVYSHLSEMLKKPVKDYNDRLVWLWLLEQLTSESDRLALEVTDVQRYGSTFPLSMKTKLPVLAEKKLCHFSRQSGSPFRSSSYAGRRFVSPGGSKISPQSVSRLGRASPRPQSRLGRISPRPISRLNSSKLRAPSSLRCRRFECTACRFLDSGGLQVLMEVLQEEVKAHSHSESHCVILHGIGVLRNLSSSSCGRHGLMGNADGDQQFATPGSVTGVSLLLSCALLNGDIDVQEKAVAALHYLSSLDQDSTSFVASLLLNENTSLPLLAKAVPKGTTMLHLYVATIRSAKSAPIKEGLMELLVEMRCVEPQLSEVFLDTDLPDVIAEFLQSSRKEPLLRLACDLITALISTDRGVEVVLASGSIQRLTTLAVLPNVAVKVAETLDCVSIKSSELLWRALQASVVDDPRQTCLRTLEKALCVSMNKFFRIPLAMALWRACGGRAERQLHTALALGAKSWLRLLQESPECVQVISCKALFLLASLCAREQRQRLEGSDLIINVLPLFIDGPTQGTRLVSSAFLLWHLVLKLV